MTQNPLKVAGFTLVILFLVIMLGMSAGCISENSPHTPSGSSVTNTPGSTVVPTQCPPASGNTTPYIIINPISPHTVGDVFEINGMTNLGPDKKMMVEVREETHLGLGPNDNKAPYYVLSQSKDYARIQGVDCQDKFWSYPVNMTGFHGGKQYWVTAFMEQEKYPHDVINYSIFYTGRGE